MKQIIIILSLVVIHFSFTTRLPAPEIETRGQYTNIDNGWYEATVKYSTSNTYTKSTYTLKVKVEYNSVTKIDFGNGGSVHSGYNNSGYYYSGGHLSFERNFNNEIVAATTRVTVSEGSVYRYYDIRID